MGEEFKITFVARKFEHFEETRISGRIVLSYVSFDLMFKLPMRMRIRICSYSVTCVLITLLPLKPILSIGLMFLLPLKYYADLKPWEMYEYTF